jgi:transcriptional regulator with GAF, ATPase, and Fis domain
MSGKPSSRRSTWDVLPFRVGLREKGRREEVHLIESALQRSMGNLSQAARDLCLSPQALHYKVRKLGLSVPHTKVDRQRSQEG